MSQKLKKCLILDLQWYGIPRLQKVRSPRFGNQKYFGQQRLHNQNRRFWSRPRRSDKWILQENEWRTFTPPVDGPRVYFWAEVHYPVGCLVFWSDFMGNDELGWKTIPWFRGPTRCYGLFETGPPYGETLKLFSGNLKCLKFLKCLRFQNVSNFRVSQFLKSLKFLKCINFWNVSNVKMSQILECLKFQNVAKIKMSQILKCLKYPWKCLTRWMSQHQIISP